MVKKIFSCLGRVAAILVTAILFQNCGSGFETSEDPYKELGQIGIASIDIRTRPRLKLGVLTHSDSLTSLEMVSVEPLNEDDCIIRYIWRHSGTKSVDGWKHHLFINEDFSGPGYVGSYLEYANIPETIAGNHSAMNVISCSMFGHDINSIRGGQHFQVVLEDIIDGKSYFSSRPEAVRIEKYIPDPVVPRTEAQGLRDVIIRLPEVYNSLKII